MSTKKTDRKPSTKAASRKRKAPAANGARGDDGPMPGKKLLQSWVEEDDHDYFAKLAASKTLRPATYLRQVVHSHVDADRKMRAETGEKPL